MMSPDEIYRKIEDSFIETPEEIFKRETLQSKTPKYSSLSEYVFNTQFNVQKKVIEGEFERVENNKLMESE
jgi:hypothetical protein